MPTVEDRRMDRGTHWSKETPLPSPPLPFPPLHLSVSTIVYLYAVATTVPLPFDKAFLNIFDKYSHSFITRLPVAEFILFSVQIVRFCCSIDA